MILEAFLVFDLEHPFDKLPKLAIRTSMILQASYAAKDGVKTNVDEPAQYIATHHDFLDWLDKWKTELDEAKNKIRREGAYSGFPKGMGPLGPP